MDCQFVQAQLALGIEEPLPESLEAHICQCDDCAALYADLLEIHVGLGDWAKQVPPPQMHEKCMEALYAQESHDRKRRRMGWVRATTAVAAAFVVGIGLYWALPKASIGSDETKYNTQAEAIDDSGMEPINPAKSLGAAQEPMMTAAPDSQETAMDAAGIQGDKKRVYHANYAIQTRDFAADLDRILTLTNAANGYVDYQSVYVSDTDGGNGLQHASLSLRIPSEALDGYLTDLSGVGTVKSSSRGVTDITENYYDVQGRLDSYKEQLLQLQGILTKTETLSDVLAIQAEMARLQTEIDSLTGQMRRMDAQVSYSSVQVELEEISKLTVAPMGSNLSDRMGAGFFDTINGIVRGFQNLLVWIVASSPLLLPLVAVGVIAFICIRRRHRRRFSTPDGDMQMHGKGVARPPEFKDSE